MKIKKKLKNNACKYELQHFLFALIMHFTRSNIKINKLRQVFCIFFALLGRLLHWEFKLKNRFSKYLSIMEI